MFGVAYDVTNFINISRVEREIDSFSSKQRRFAPLLGDFPLLSGRWKTRPVWASHHTGKIREGRPRRPANCKCPSSEVQPRRQVFPAAHRHQEKIRTFVDATTSSSLLGTGWKYNDL
ncbi:uncharacterized protein LOC119591027 [Penaeus monodon]|uniref:uncharacterized protein LOC119591027 n=1 Tax=Penaeus monodon TaxID=6687 RepID=UPI0018A7B8E9|nr:uncharacterized protein LOC119591027 [Penaeus monodon]